MIAEILVWFIVGGLVVSAFALMGEVLAPKSFAGIFGAAPSVALATLALTAVMHNASYVSAEGRSLIAGGVALLVYSLVVAWLFAGKGRHAVIQAVAPWVLWSATAFGIWDLVLR